MWGGNWGGGNVFAFGRKLFDVLSETLRRLAVNSLAFEEETYLRLAVSGILTVVWGELGGVEEVSFSSCGGWMKCIVVSFWFCFCAFCGCADGGCFVCFLFEFVKGI